MTWFPTADPAAAERYRRSGAWQGPLLDAHLEAAPPSRIAVVDAATRLDYATLGDLVTRAAAGLRRLDVARGDVVSLQLPNWWEALVVHLAAIRIGAVSNPLMPILRERELRFSLRSAAARVLVTAAEFRGFDHGGLATALRDELPDLEHVVVVRGRRPGATTFDALLADTGGGHPEPGRGAADPVVLLYTSGTESDPKGAVHSHETLGYEDRSVVTHFGLTGDDVVFMPSPVAHITGVLYGFHLATILGTTVVYQDVWEPGEALRLVEAQRCSFVVAATPFLHGLTYHERLGEHDVSSLRVFACGGADVPPDLIRDAEDRLGCLAVRVYGSTEIPTLTMGHADDPPELRARTDGRVVGAAEARILDDDGAPAAPGEVGNVHARGPEAFLGYHGRSVETDDGWIDTGDRGWMDAEGYLTISGRSKDVIVRGGENISAKEVEDLLYAHPAVAEVAVVAMPDPRLVERACAVVVPRPGARPELADLTGFPRRAGDRAAEVPGAPRARRRAADDADRQGAEVPLARARRGARGRRVGTTGYLLRLNGSPVGAAANLPITAT